VNDALVADLAYLPGDQLTGIEQIEELSGGALREIALNGIEPDLNSLRDGPALPYLRDDDRGPVVEGDVGELRILGEKDQVLCLEPTADRGIRQTTLAQNDDMLDVVTRLLQPVVEGKGEVLVKEDFHEACRTAGGRCAATWAA